MPIPITQQLTTICIYHLDGFTARDLALHEFDDPRVEYAAFKNGCFMRISEVAEPMNTVLPDCLQQIREWQVEFNNTGWLLLSPDGAAVSLPLYEWSN